MISALFYLQYHSFRNRLVGRFKRLKQPKYLFGALAGAEMAVDEIEEIRGADQLHQAELDHVGREQQREPAPLVEGSLGRWLGGRRGGRDRRRIRRLTCDGQSSHWWFRCRSVRSSPRP